VTPGVIAAVATDISHLLSPWKPPRKIAIVNASTVLTDADVKAAVPALQQQVTLDFAPVHGVDAEIGIFSHADVVTGKAAGWEQIIVADHSDQAGALGYHDLTKEGKPIGFVFAGDDEKYGLSWTVTLSHELLEQLLDPNINRAIPIITAKGGTLVCEEPCDAPEDDKFAYERLGVKLSDFCYPAWWQPGATGPYDHGRHLTAPLQLAEGGYIGEMPLTGKLQWTQRTATLGASKRHQQKLDKPERRRHHRRHKPRETWRHSEPVAA
jgi:hypothetical protein